MYKLNSISVRILTGLFWELYKIILEFIWKNKYLRIAKETMKRTVEWDLPYHIPESSMKPQKPNWYNISIKIDKN